MKLRNIIIITLAALILSGCATNYYGSRGYGHAQYESHGYVVVYNWRGTVVFSGDCAYYFDQGDLVIGSTRYSGDRYTFSFGM